MNQSENKEASYAIIGFGKIGQALAPDQVQQVNRDRKFQCDPALWAKGPTV